MLKDRIKLKSITTIIEPLDFEEMADFGIDLEKPTTPEPPVVVSANTPKTLKDFVGQEPTKHILKIIVGAALKKKNPIPNLLLSGGFGHGKTTLAKLIISELNVPYKLIDASVAEEVLENPDPKKVYIIDEIHNIPSIVADSLNILIDGNRLHIIGCTTSPGRLAGPFRSRFRLLYLDDYTIEDISKIIKNSAKRSKTPIEAESIILIAIRSKLNPRIALSILDFLREMQIVENLKSISVDTTNEALKNLRIDKFGLTELDRKYLSILKYDNPIGLRHIMSVMSLDSETIEYQIEPYLLKIGVIDRTSRGRLKVWNGEEIV